ncbi:zinc finger CCCH domain-containing protein 5 [Melia azedarach]|uniref:Zinc finger CCCH domain-containing protein 5 n=1 Tax=Melia azedarach TaxID=155640 RepID=A0ACC1Y3K7_MELAZ|nr:zinc finger CCCH domain-containing protein 5 [Melia azedarach]
MEEPNHVAEGSSREEGNETILCRKEKKKLAKKKKRKEKRKEMAEKEREEEEAGANDAEEQRKLEMMMKEVEEERERALKEFEERERIWIQEMELKKKFEEEERKKALEEEREKEEAKKKLQVEKENECDEDDDWEYVEEGPAEIIWQGNEIIIRKKKVRVPKKDMNQPSEKEDADRPTSNPLPPQSEAFTNYQHAQQALENVARQVPNFGTEQDKAHCPFHLKTGACRFGQRCSRVHFYPDKSCTLLIKNMYNGPGLAWEQDEGLEVCRNGSSHLRGNVYVHFKLLESAVLAYRAVNGRYFAGKQITCEFVNVSRWKIAICGEFMKSRLKTCSRGMACNFIHCFRNPGGDYEWANWDKPAPRYWMKEMAALFGYSDESECWKQTEQDHLGRIRNSNKIDTANMDRHWSRRSRSRSHDGEHRVRDSTCCRRHANDTRKRIKLLDENLLEEGTELKDNGQNESRSDETNSDGSWSDREGGKGRDRHHGRTRKHMKSRCSISEKSTDYRDTRDRIYEANSDGNRSDSDRDVETRHVHSRKGLTYKSGGKLRDDKHEDSNKRDDTGSIDWSDGDRSTESYQSLKRRSLDHQRNFPKCVDADGVGNYRSYFTDSGDDLLDRDKERHHSRRRKHSRHQTEESEFSDDKGQPTKKSKKTRQNGRSDSEKSDPKREKTDKHSSRRSHSKKEKNGTDYRHLKSKGDGECSNSGQYDERYKRIDEQDRWKPINAEEDRKSGRKTNSICSGRSKSQDFDSESYDNEKNDVDRWESKDVYKKHHEMRGNSSDDQDRLEGTPNPDGQYFDSELHHESRLRDSSESSRERQSHTDTHEENYRSDNAKHRSRRHKQRHHKEPNL